MTATTKHIPGKRIKTWHRHAKRNPVAPALSLRAFARHLIKYGSSSEIETAKRWLGVA